MRICLIAPVPPYRGGIAKYCHLLARELERRHDLLLLSYRRQYPVLLFGRKSQVDPGIDRDSIRREFRDLSYDIDSANPLSWRRTARRIADFGTELVVFPWWVVYWGPMYLYLLRFLKRRGIRAVFLCINVFEHEDSLFKRSLTKLVLRKVSSLIVHSGRERDELLSFHPAASVELHLLPLFRYETVPAPRKTATYRLLFFGFVRPYKGLDILLRAVGILKERDISLKIVGEFWHDKEEYLALINEFGIGDRVEVVDRYVSDEEMGCHFGEADLVVLPYLESRTSGVIATAYGYGRPVLATDVGGFREVVLDGTTGKIVAPGDPAAVAEGIEWFLENRERDFRLNIEEFARQKMSWGSLVDLIEKKGEAVR